MARRRKNVKVLGISLPRKAALLLLALAALAAASIATTVGTVLSASILRARVTLLETALKFDIDNSLLSELESRLAAIGTPVDPSRLQNLLEKITELESKLPHPVVFRSGDLAAHEGKYVYLVGTISRVSERTPHIFLTVADVSVPLFNMAGKVQLKEGMTVAVKGRVGRYQGDLQVVPDSTADVILSR